MIEEIKSKQAEVSLSDFIDIVIDYTSYLSIFK